VLRVLPVARSLLASPSAIGSGKVPSGSSTRLTTNDESLRSSRLVIAAKCTVSARCRRRRSWSSQHGIAFQRKAQTRIRNGSRLRGPRPRGPAAARSLVASARPLLSSSVHPWPRLSGTEIFQAIEIIVESGSSPIASQAEGRGFDLRASLPFSRRAYAALQRSYLRRRLMMRNLTTPRRPRVTPAL